MANRIDLKQCNALMAEALREAQLAYAVDEVPVGAVIYDGQEIIARAHNNVELSKNPVGHAEVLALQAAATKLGDWRLNDLILCVTLEPCTMCLGSIKQSRIGTVIYGASDADRGACGSIFDLSQDKRISPVNPKVISGIMEDECREILQRFFQSKR